MTARCAEWQVSDLYSPSGKLSARVAKCFKPSEPGFRKSAPVGPGPRFPGRHLRRPPLAVFSSVPFIWPVSVCQTAPQSSSGRERRRHTHPTAPSPLSPCLFCPLIICHYSAEPEPEPEPGLKSWPRSPHLQTIDGRGGVSWPTARHCAEQGRAEQGA